MTNRSVLQTGKKLVALLASCFLLTTCSNTRPGLPINNKKAVQWVGTWGTAPQLVEPGNMPPAPGLTNTTLRQVVRVSIGGERLRLHLSNVFSKEAVTIRSAAIAVAGEGSVIEPATLKLLQFGGKDSTTLQPYGEVFSDAAAFHLLPGSRLAITIYFGETSATLTGHPGSRTTSYIRPGNAVSAADFTGAFTTDHWYMINGIDVQAAPGAAAVVALGNSITDGRGSGTNRQNRWTDVLSDRLLNNSATRNYGVLNLGIGGNCVLRGGLGPTALNRFDRDVLAQSGVRWLLILEGINDIGGIRNAEAAPKVAQELIDAYSLMADKAHAKGIRVYGCTILPFEKSAYDTPFRQQARDRINAWIRNNSKFDAVIDFDPIMRNPDAVRQLLPQLHTGDYLHPNEAGYKVMGEAIDLALFARQ